MNGYCPNGYVAEGGERMAGGSVIGERRCNVGNKNGCVIGYGESLGGYGGSVGGYGGSVGGYGGYGGPPLEA